MLALTLESKTFYNYNSQIIWQYILTKIRVGKMPDKKKSEENINWEFYRDLFKKGIKDIKERFEILWKKDNDLKRMFETLLEKDNDFKQRYQTLLEMYSDLKEKEIYIHITMIFENIIKTIIGYFYK